MKPDDLSSAAAARTLRLVEALLQHPEGLGVPELLAEAGGPRSSLFTLLQTLRSLGYVDQRERRGRYIPGPRLLAWAGSPAAPSADLTLAFYQETTRRSWPETLALVVPSPSGPLVLAQVEAPSLVRSAFTAGQTYPALQAATRILSDEPDSQTHQAGYALENASQSLNLALPVCRNGVTPEAALLLSAPAFRWPSDSLLQTFLPELRAMAARLSYRLGAPFYAPYRAGGVQEMQPASPLSAEEIGRFLQGPWAARLACLRPDGTPHVIPVWQEWDGEAFYIAAWQGSQWATFIQQDPHVSLTIDEPWPPLRRVVSRGMAELLGAGFDLPGLLARLSRRYLGQSAPPGWAEHAFRIRPEVLRGWQGL